MGPATAGSERASAGTVVIVHDQEPPTLRNDWEDNNLTATALVVNNIFSNGAVYNANAVLTPRLLTALPKLVKQRPVTVTFRTSRRRCGGRQAGVTCADLRA